MAILFFPGFAQNETLHAGEANFTPSVNLHSDAENGAPQVMITGLTVDGIDFSEWIHIPEILTLDHTKNNFRFTFSSFPFDQAEVTGYQTKLENFSEEWFEIPEPGFVEYLALKPGRYILKVRVIRNGFVTGDETTYTFRIRWAYYQTIWFYLIITLFLTTLFYTFYKFRINNIIKMEHMRTRIAADLHDDIGSTLSSIYLMCSMTKSGDKQSRLLEVLKKISENSGDILNSMDDIIWSVNPQNDTLKNLTIRLREYAISICEAKGIEFCMNLKEVDNNLKLGMDERRNIYLIAKEAINNAVKHSECSTLEMTITITINMIEVVIHDNGCGFDPDMPTSRNGLVNMRRRAEQINAKLIIRSEKDGGTAIRLKTEIHKFI
jgi:signal transduction histidine kinase